MSGDCCDCGACCFSDSDTYVPVTQEDRVRLGATADSITRERDGQYYLVMSEGHCAQLEHAEGAWVCGIYPRRPEACRTLVRGSAACLEERALKRLRASRASQNLSTRAAEGDS